MLARCVSREDRGRCFARDSRGQFRPLWVTVFMIECDLGVIPITSAFDDEDFRRAYLERGIDRIDVEARADMDAVNLATALLDLDDIGASA
jgi:hypothetical protein